MSASEYRRWRDGDNVVHWVESQRNECFFTGCNKAVTTFRYPGYALNHAGTTDPPTCIRCVVEADEDVYAAR